MTGNKQQVVTRFAPSPTGFLHIGGARTALFCWAFARHHGGQFLLRIEDTDRARSTNAAIEAILDGLSWLGLEADAAPVFQHANAARHIKIAEDLLAAGHAYRCTCTAEEVEAMREKARANGQHPRYDGTCRDKNHPPDAPHVVRFKAPREGSTSIADRVQGTVSIENDQLDDLVLLRTDRSPTYMLSVVVDDHDMGITHIIRGDDHLTNAVRQSQIYKALGWEIPVFAHIPLIHGADGAKLSKRHGALGVDAYRDMGYLPEALRNYLARLGWSHGDDELFSTDQLIEWFELDGIGKSPARFDMDKLEHVNAHHLRHSDDATLAEWVMPLLVADYGDEAGDEEMREKLLKALPALKEKAKKRSDISDGAAFMFTPRPLALSEKSAAALKPETLAYLALLVEEFAALAEWSHDSLESTLKTFMEAQDIKLGAIAPGLRAALTGTGSAIGIYDVLTILGKDEALARIRDRLPD